MKRKSGHKFDTGKPAMDLVAPQFILELGKLCAYGATKVGPRNWELGMRWGRVYAALQRHALAWWAGEEDDAETKQSHLIAVAWNAMVLWTYSKVAKYKKFDDRNDIPGAKR